METDQRIVEDCTPLDGDGAGGAGESDSSSGG
jgi:hypothetical protein